MNLGDGFWAGLRIVALGAFVLGATQGPDEAVGRPARIDSSPAAIEPKGDGAPGLPAAPEGIPLSADSAADRAPLRLAAAEASAPSPSAADAAVPAQTEAVDTPTPAAGTGLLNIESGQPLSITADELEAIELPDGRRQLLFNRSVNVEQGGLLVSADRLEAHYAAKASQPDRLLASGNVRVKQKARELSCAKATYFPGEERLECVGNARLRDGSNQVDGERIEILFAQDRIRVRGGAVVNVAPDDEKPAEAAAEATP